MDSDYEEEESVKFSDMGLDYRILEAIVKFGWERPTSVQAEAIPLFLKGRDILAKARTGSGKTAAYLIPLIHRLLESKSTSSTFGTKALILSPTRELCKQISEQVQSLTSSCRREITSANVSGLDPGEFPKSSLTDKHDIIVGTPLKVLDHLKEGNVKFKKSLQYLIIDEADLLFAFTNQNDLDALLNKLPSLYQCFVTSVTLPEDVKELKNLILHNPVVLKLEEPPLPIDTQLTQYVVKIEPVDKAILLISLLKLNLMRGRTIIFANDVNRCYKLHLFLNMFGIKNCVLNAELPVNSRCHIIDQFNRGKYNIIIAADVPEQTKRSSSHKKKKKKFERSVQDREYGVSRGIDFQFISNVVNFDFPPDVTMYIHRVGRTARASLKGTALSLVSLNEIEAFQKVEKELKKFMPDCTCVFKDFAYNMASLDGFRYRARDAWFKCTSIAVKECRIKEISVEMQNSKKLKAFFAKNPQDLAALRHDVIRKPVSIPLHLRHIPEYNVPKALKRVAAEKKQKQMKSVKSSASECSKEYLKRQKDPLRSLKFSGFKEKRK